MSNLPGIFRYNIKSIDDFPIQDATTITLNSGEYYIESTLVTSKQFIIPDGAVVAIRGWDPFVSGIIYTGVLACFKGLDFVSLTNDLIFVSTPIGEVFDFNNIASVEAQMFMTDSVYIDCAGIGITKNIKQFSGYFTSFQFIGQGFNIDGIRFTNLSQSSTIFWNNEVTTMFTFTGSIEGIQLNGMEFVPNVNESLFDFKVGAIIDSANINSNVFNNTLGGSLFVVGSRDQKDPNLFFNGNSNMPDSIVFGNMYLSTTEQVSIVQNVITVVSDVTTGGANIWTELGNTSRFNFDDTLGRYTYTGLEITNVEIISTTSLEKQGGGSDYIETILLLNGVEIIGSAIGTDNTNPTSVTSIGDVEINTGDYLELAVRNTDSNANINISVSNFIIKN